MPAVRNDNKPATIVNEGIMEDQAGARIQILGDAETVGGIVELLESEGLRVVSHGPVDDPGRLALDLETIGSVVTIASTLFFQGPIVPQILHLLRRRGRQKDEQRLILQGPGGRFELSGVDELPDDQAIAIFRAAAGRPA
jgi:hypothetical protein